MTFNESVTHDQCDHLHFEYRFKQSGVETKLCMQATANERYILVFVCNVRQYVGNLKVLKLRN